MWKRNQSMMAEMSKWEFIHQLIFVNPTVSIRTFLKPKSDNANSSLDTISKALISRSPPNILVYTPITFVPCKKYIPLLGRVESAFSLKMIRHLNKRMPYILFMNCPNITFSEILDELLAHAKLSLFDISDDFLELGYDSLSKELFRENLTKYVKSADLVLTVNEHVKTKYAYLNANIHVIRNGTNYDNFDRQTFKLITALDKIKQNKIPIIGYAGIANMGRIDSDLLDYLIEKKPDYQFVFVGPVHENFKKRYVHYGNVHMLGTVHYQELPSYIQYFNVAIVPFKQNENTKGNDLLKLHDFLAMGKPIVSTNIGGAKDLEAVIQVAETPVEFLDGIVNSLYSDHKEDIARRKNVAFKNSWHYRVQEIERILRKELGIKVLL